MVRGNREFGRTTRNSGFLYAGPIGSSSRCLQRLGANRTDQANSRTVRHHRDGGITASATAPRALCSFRRIEIGGRRLSELHALEFAVQGLSLDTQDLSGFALIAA